jgi:hypothetical protein
MTLPSVAVWRRLDLDHGLGFARLGETRAGYEAHGLEVASHGGADWAVRFRVVVGRDWRTEAAEVEVVQAERVRRVTFDVGADEVWRVDGAADDALAGCLDIDIAATPFTNTLPVKRLGLAVGASADIDVVWVGVPDLAVERGRQRYTRLPAESGHRYEYLSLSGNVGPPYVLTLDDDDVVIDYERFARRVSA